MPLLRHLDLTLSLPAILWGPHDLPQLRSAVLNPITAASVTLPWDQLTSLGLGHIDGFERRKCLAILQRTPMLVHCTLDLSAYRGSADDIRVTLPCLRSLVFISKTTYKFHHIQPLTDILASLIVPALLKLSLPEPFLGSDPIGSLTSFITTSGCKLREMHITAKTTEQYGSFLDYRMEFPSIAISFSAEWEVPVDNYQYGDQFHASRISYRIAHNQDSTSQGRANIIISTKNARVLVLSSRNLSLYLYDSFLFMTGFLPKVDF
ncbi:hypothetical protein C8R45DRAFT_1151056 [Mycena sanguinolenta]|nr:hypothetical protein C8R45DRAFT_1151056 [Mycena sanguinolenta]